MQLLKSTLPIVVELSDDDIRFMHLSFHYYKALLKHNTYISKQKRRQKLLVLNRMITLIDLLL